MQRQRKAKAELFKQAAAAGTATGAGAGGAASASKSVEAAAAAVEKKTPAAASPPPANGHCRVAVRVPARKKGGQDVALPPHDFDARKTTLAEFVNWVRQQPTAVRALYGVASDTATDGAPLRVVLRACGIDASEGGAGDSNSEDDVFASTLHDLGVNGEVAAMVTLAPVTASTTSESSSEADPFAKRQDKGKFADGGKVHTMLSTGVLKANTNKATEYENGDGTVYEAAIDAPEDEEPKDGEAKSNASNSQDTQKEDEVEDESEDEDAEEDADADEDELESDVETDESDGSLGEVTGKRSEAADEGSLPDEEDDEEEDEEEEDDEEEDDDEEDEEEDDDDEDGDDDDDEDDDDDDEKDGNDSDEDGSGDSDSDNE